MADRISYGRNDFSLKSLAKDVVKMGTAPIKLAVSSVTGKPANIKYDTKLGKAVGGLHDQSTKLLTGTVKAVGDTITLGAASKLANVVRKDKYKEKAYQYHELKKSDTGIKAIDKASDIVSKVAPVAGGIAGGYTLGKGIQSLSKSTGIPANILTQVKEQAKQGLDNNTENIKSQELLDKMKDGDEIMPSDVEDVSDKNLLGSFGATNWLLVAGAVILILLLASSKSGRQTVKRYAR